MTPTPAQLASLKMRFPGIGEPTLLRNAEQLLARPHLRTPISNEVPAPQIAPKAKESRKDAKPARRSRSQSPTPPHDSSILAATFASLSADYQSSIAELERNLCGGPLAKGEDENGNPRKFLVSVTSFRRRLIDEDNLCEKYHIDCCRYAGLLRSDDPGQARIVTRQEKVATKDEERTEIEITPITSP